MTFSLSDRRRGEETAKKENLKFVSSWRGEKKSAIKSVWYRGEGSKTVG